MTSNLITGIQQIGIGVTDASESFKWYNKNLGLDVPLFDDEAEAKLMVKYTVGNIRRRRAILAINMAGGGGAEIWESKYPLPLASQNPPKLGDLGIFSAKIKCQNIQEFATKHHLEVYQSPNSKPVVWIKDNYGNQIQVVEDDSWFNPAQSNTGGVLGAIIGVSDINKSIKLYQEVLGLTEIIYDVRGKFDDIQGVENHECEYRRVLLRKTQTPEGAFARLLGNIEIELIQAINIKAPVIFEGRSWGDLGYIHLCFDVLDMDNLNKKLSSNGFPFVVDSANSFDMGDAAGRFTYIEDPDGTLLEFVETHKVPVLKKIGWFINLKKRGVHKPLHTWMIKALGLGRVKMNK